jgi:hypothetical protein
MKRTFLQGRTVSIEYPTSNVMQEEKLRVELMEIWLGLKSHPELASAQSFSLWAVSDGFDVHWKIFWPTIELRTALFAAERGPSGWPDELRLVGSGCRYYPGWWSPF